MTHVHDTRPLTFDPRTSQLDPPAGAIYGKTSYTPPGYSQDATWDNDDTRLSGIVQKASGTLAQSFWVYWVNGEKPPYYIVIQQLSGPFSPGNITAPTPASQGFFQTGVQLTTEILGADGKPYPTGGDTGATLLGFGPTSFSSSPTNPNAPVNIDTRMTLLVNIGGSLQPSEFEATSENQVWLDGWGIKVISEPASLKLSTYFHQQDVWDPSADLPSNWPRWYLKVYDLAYEPPPAQPPQTGNTAPPAKASITSLSLQTLSAWRFNVKNGDPMNPPSLPVTFRTTVEQGLAAYHNPDACKTRITGAGPIPTIVGAHHLQYKSATFSNDWKDDLQRIVNQSPQ